MSKEIRGEGEKQKVEGKESEERKGEGKGGIERGAVEREVKRV